MSGGARHPYITWPFKAIKIEPKLFPSIDALAALMGIPRCALLAKAVLVGLKYLWTKAGAEAPSLLDKVDIEGIDEAILGKYRSEHRKRLWMTDILVEEANRYVVALQDK